jgi:hypothetical protein
MNIKTKTAAVCALLASMVVATTGPLFAQDYSEIISEEMLREVFVFEEGAALKYSACEELTHPSCVYIWGEPSKRDATRENLGLRPEGSKLMVIFAEASGMKDFERSISVYPDAGAVEDLGVRSVWSPIRQQLSLITDGDLIIHVNIEDENNEDPKTAAIAVAIWVLEGL